MSTIKRSPGKGEHDRYERAYERLRRKLGNMGYMIKGTVTLRTLACGAPLCRCHRNPRWRHGPYYFWTSKKGGKSVAYKLSEEEGKLYFGWARTRQWVDALMEEMYRVSAQVAKAKLGRPPPWFRIK